MPTRTANARWEGTLQEGRGTMRMATGSYEGPYSFQSRFEEGDGTNPEELIAAAHAGCFAMSLAAVLAEAGHTAERLEVVARCVMDEVEGRVPGLDEEGFRSAAEGAKENCPVSKALAGNVEITLDARLA